MLLKDLNKNEEAVVKAVLCNVAVKKRLFNLGLTEGVKVRVIAFSPFFEPVEITFNNTFLAVGKSIAEKIEVE